MSTLSHLPSNAPSTAGPWIGMVAAFPWEVRGLLRYGSRARQNRSQQQPYQGPPGNSRFKVHSLILGENPVLLAIGGVGAENSFCAAQYLARNFPLRGLATIGFAGGLASGMKAGEVILGDRVLDEATRERFECDTTLLPGHFHRRGNLLSVNAVIGSSERKRRLGEQWQAVAADMESAGVARAASQAGLPFGAVKAITDPAEQSLSIDFNRCRREDKDFSLWAIVWQGLTTTSGVADLVRLAWNARQAAAALATALQ